MKNQLDVILIGIVGKLNASERLVLFDRLCNAGWADIYETSDSPLAHVDAAYDLELMLAKDVIGFTDAQKWIGKHGGAICLEVLCECLNGSTFMAMTSHVSDDADGRRRVAEVVGHVRKCDKLAAELTRLSGRPISVPKC